MQTVQVGEFKSEFSTLMDLVRNKGQEFVIEYGKNHKKVAMLVPYAKPNSKKIDFDICEATNKIGLEILSFCGNDAMKLFSLPHHHSDPFDRMIISQAISNDFYLASADSKFRLYNCKML
jgi:antitoxin (DNA-binding transcriptional repressor) of toxin-antitoxin stability system